MSQLLCTSPTNKHLRLFTFLQVLSSNNTTKYFYFFLFTTQNDLCTLYQYLAMFRTAFIRPFSCKAKRTLRQLKFNFMARTQIAASSYIRLWPIVLVYLYTVPVCCEVLATSSSYCLPLNTTWFKFTSRLQGSNQIT